jgi:hypothetical protein
MGSRSRSLVPLVCLGTFLVGCGGGGGGGGGGESATAISFSGTILAQNVIRGGGASLDGLQGVGVSVGEGARFVEGVTDADGNFILVGPPTGMQILHLDGSGAVGGTFPDLDIPLVIGGGSSNLLQPVVLPDLSDGTTTNVPVDSGGMTTMDMTVGDALTDGYSLEVPAGTAITVHGLPVSGSVDLNVTMVERINVPMPLPDGLNPGLFVTIQPGGAAFDPPLSITLPNVGGFPPGQLLDVWSFDHDVNDWVNRSQEYTPARPGQVDMTGTTIVANDVISEGGWHSAPQPVDTSCATTLTGLVVTAGEMLPLEGTLISLSTGQFGRTDASGRYTIVSVPAYDAGLLPDVCVPVDVELRAIAPVPYGSTQVTTIVSAIVTGGTTEVPTIEIPVSTSGSIAGSVLDRNRNGVQGTVFITGDASEEIETDKNGTFFRAAYAPGDYTATFTFPSMEVGTTDFTVTANHLTPVPVVEPTGQPNQVVVQVLNFVQNQSVPVGNACVTLQGGGSAPLFQVTNASGNATFDNAPNGPYTVTAQVDANAQFGTTRIGSTVVGVNAGASAPHIVIPFFDFGDLAFPLADATLDGNVLNEPGGTYVEYQVATEQGAFFFAEGTASGGFSQAIPSGYPLDLGVVTRSLLDGKIESGVFVADRTATPGQNLAQDFDLASAHAFDRVVPITLTNEQTGHSFFYADLFLGDLDYSLSDGQSLPDQICLPDFSATKFAGLPPILEIGSDGFSSTFEDSSCSFPFGNSTPSALAFAFLTPPTIQQPTNGASFADYGPGDVVDFTLGTGTGATPGLNLVSFVVDIGKEVFVFWDVIVAPGVTTLTVPPVFPGKPMFGAGFAQVTVDTLRFDFPGFAYADFFDRNLATNVEAVVANPLCEASQGHSFTIGLASEASGPPSLRARKGARSRLR